MPLNLGSAVYFLRADNKDFNKKLDSAKKKAVAMSGAIGRTLTAMGAIVAAGLGAGVKAAGDFEDAMTKSLAIMGDVSKELRDEMSRTAIEVSQKTTFSARQAADAYFFLASAGLDAKQSIAALPAVARFAQAGNFDLALATDLVTDAQSALGLSVEDTAKNLENMTRVSDVLVKANTLANASVQQFSESLTNKAAAAARTASQEMEDVVAVLAAYADQGVKGAEAGEKINQVLRDLQGKAIKNEDAFKKLGITVFDTDGKMRNIVDVLFDVDNALEKLSDKERIKALGKSGLGIQEKSVIALKQLIGLSPKIREYASELRNAGGVTDDVSKRQLASFNAQLVLLKNNFVAFLIPIGNSLIPVLKLLSSVVSFLVGKFAAFAENNKVLTTVLTLVTAAFAALMLTLGPMFIALPFIVAAFSALAGLLPLIVPLIGALIATALGFIAVVTKLAVFIVGPLIGAFLVLKAVAVRNWDAIANAAREAFERIVFWINEKMGNEAPKNLEDALKKIKNRFKIWELEFLHQIWRPLWKFVVDWAEENLIKLLNTIIKFLDKAWEQFIIWRRKIMNLWEAFWIDFEHITGISLNDVFGLFKGELLDVEKLLDRWQSDILQAWNDFWDDMLADAGRWIKRITNLFDDFLRAVSGGNFGVGGIPTLPSSLQGFSAQSKQSASQPASAASMTFNVTFKDSFVGPEEAAERFVKVIAPHISRARFREVI